MQSISRGWGFDNLRAGPNPGTHGRLASRITSQLYLSDYWTARDVQQLEELGITHVVSLLDFNPEIPNCIAREKKLHINVYDESRANILQHLPTTTAFIIAAIQENKTNKVLVHCMMGMSRSPTVVCAYLVATTNMTASESITQVRSKRAIVYPNLGFQQQLQEYSTQFSKTKAKSEWFFMWAEIFSFSGIVSWVRRGKAGAIVSPPSSSSP